MKVTLILFVLFFEQTVWAEGRDDICESMVPKGKLVEKDGREYKIKTRAGTRITVELYRNGKLEEASGKNLNRGDDFEPGQGLISLTTAAQAATIPGINLETRWSLDHDKKLGWIYEFNGEHKGVETDILVDARNGKVILNHEDL